MVLLQLLPMVKLRMDNSLRLLVVRQRLMASNSRGIRRSNMEAWLDTLSPNSVNNFAMN